MRPGPGGGRDPVRAPGLHPLSHLDAYRGPVGGGDRRRRRAARLYRGHRPAGYGHLTDALHAWCGVHLLRDLKGLYDFEPGQQDWASQLAGLLIEARGAAAAARLAGLSVLDAAVLEDLVTRYRELAAAGLTANLYRRTATARDARRIGRRFLSFENLILNSH